MGEARSWIGTPYRIRGRIRGAGADCGSLLLGILIHTGMIDERDTDVYSADCWAHWSEDKYFKEMLRYSANFMEGVAYKSTELLPGTIILGAAAGNRYYNHGAIVTEWPMVIHAVHPRVAEVDATTNHMWSYNKIAAFEMNRLSEVIG